VSIRRAAGWLATAIAVAFAGWHLEIAATGVPSPIEFRAGHLLFALVLIFLFAFSRREVGEVWRSAGDLLLLACSVAAIGYLLVFEDYVISRYATVDDLMPADWALSFLTVVVIVEATRRTIGWSLPLTMLAFYAYVLLFTRVDLQTVMDQTYLTTEGVLGIPISASATFIMLYVLFGSFVERMGTGKLFIDLALALAGWTAGGPAKVAVITSALFGTISGNAVSNVMTTGVFTIPLMKQIGYRPAFAGAVEAVASTGGQITPPIMGAAAFIMAEFLGVSYLTIATYAILPATLFYVAVFFAVHFEAKRTGMSGLARENLPRAGQVLRESGHLVLPVVVIVVVLVLGYSASFAALIGILSVVPCAALRRSSRAHLNPANLLAAVVEGVRATIGLAAACACAGAVIGVVSVSGIGIEFSALVVRAAADTLIPALILTALAGLVLGMGLPTTPAYIIMVALMVPALVKLGIALPAAHMFVFYFAILSTITPPVALAVFAACSLADSKLWPTGLEAVRLGATGYVVPFMFVFGPSLLMIGPWYEILMTTASATIGVIALAAGLLGYTVRPIGALERLALVSASILLIKPGWMTDLLGIAVIAVTLLIGRRRDLRSGT